MRFATELPGLAIDVGAGDSGSCAVDSKRSI